MFHQVLSQLEKYTREQLIMCVKTEASETVGDLCFSIEQNIGNCPDVWMSFIMTSHLKVSIGYSLYAITWGSDNPEKYK